MSRRAMVAASLVLACRPPATAVPPGTPAAGLTIALYQHAGRSFGVVDDRRWIEVRGGEVVLEHVDPGAALATLLIEPLGGSALVVGPCARDHVVRCTVTGEGRHLVRLHYVSSTLGYRTEHAVTMVAGDRATLASRFAIATPRWGRRADVTLHDGLPGDERPPAEIVRASLALDGSIAIRATAPRELPARLRRVYDGALRGEGAVETEPEWAGASVPAVWVWLELDEGELPFGPVYAHLAVPGEPERDVVVPAAGREQRGRTLRLPLWIDGALRGTRQRTVTGIGSGLVDDLSHAVANTGDVVREVWIEERLRAARRRELVRGPTRPALTTAVARTKVIVEPGRIARDRYAIAYAF